MTKRKGVLNRWITVLSLCLPLILSVNSLKVRSAANDDHSPLAEVSNTVVDLGKVQEGDVLNACFAFHNAGKEVLHIHKVKSGCDCIHVKYPQAIAPDARAEICLSINTLGIHGRRKFRTTVYCNDSSRPVIHLQAWAQIAPMVTLTPDRVFLKGKPEENLRKEILIKTQGKMPLDVRIEQHDLQNRVKTTLKPLMKNRQYLLTVENLVKDAGSFRVRLILNTNYPGHKKIAVPVFVYIQAPVGLYPESLDLKPSRCRNCKGKFTGELLVRAHDKKSLKISSVGLPLPECKYNIEPLIADQAYKIQVECVRKKDNSGKYFLNIQTERPDYRKIEVPIVFKKK